MPALLASLLLAVLLAAPRADARALLATCEEDCQVIYEKNVKKCISETQLGEPPAIQAQGTAKAAAKAAADYVPPKDTGFELAEKECRRLQDPELAKCKEGCNKKDCVAIAKKCDDSFDKGTMLAAWCRQKEGC